MTYRTDGTFCGCIGAIRLCVFFCRILVSKAAGVVVFQTCTNLLALARCHVGYGSNVEL